MMTLLLVALQLASVSPWIAFLPRSLMWIVLHVVCAQLSIRFWCCCPCSMIALVMCIVGGRYFGGTLSGFFPSLGVPCVGMCVWVVVCHSSIDDMGDDMICAMSNIVLSMSSSVCMLSNS